MCRSKWAGTLAFLGRDQALLRTVSASWSAAVEQVHMAARERDFDHVSGLSLSPRLTLAEQSEPVCTGDGSVALAHRVMCAILFDLARTHATSLGN